MHRKLGYVFLSIKDRITPMPAPKECPTMRSV